MIVINIFILLIIATTMNNAKEFNVYWNIPTFMCSRYNLPFIDDIVQKFGIIQNKGDMFRGNELSILYDPGKFPALLQNSTSKRFILRNGGVPQEGNLTEHLDIFRQHMNELVPDYYNNGLAIIDFESWRPTYRQNFGTLQPYKDISVDMLKRRHPFWSVKRLEATAAKDFEYGARLFMHETLRYAKELRPYARWGYYGLPYCFNGKGKTIEYCASNIQRENDHTQWLYDASDVIYPSVYMAESIEPQNRPKMVRGRVAEAIRLANRVRRRQRPQVIVYYRYVFTDTLKFLSETDVYDIVNVMKSEGADGIILWGSSSDLNTKKKCIDFYEYFENTLGPVLKSFEQQYSVKSIV